MCVAVQYMVHVYRSYQTTLHTRTYVCGRIFEKGPLCTKINVSLHGKIVA